MVAIRTADGLQEVGSILETDCCPADICQIDVCSMMCNFIQLLPDGPMWDRAKMEAMDRYRTDSCNGVSCVSQDLSCTSLVNYAVYAGRVLHNMLFTALWPALRESDPRTAWLTLDDWIDRLGWQNCYEGSCRDPGLGALSLIEVQGECGPVYCGANGASQELTLAVKRGIVLALTRLNMRPIRTLENMNWIIEPLGAVLRPRYEDVEAGCPIECPENPQFNICPVADKSIDSAPSNGDCGFRSTRIPASYDALCNVPSTIFPGVAAAFCIVVSLLRLKGCCEPKTVLYNCNC